MNCTHCSAEVSESLAYCCSCGTFAGFPNVRIAQKAEETEALESRYFDALIDAETRGALAETEAFETAVRDSSQAVVAMDLDRMRLLAVNSNELYSNYQMTVRARSRQPALLPNDQRRLAVDGRLWGSFGEEIRYAALSLNSHGLTSYGNCFATLKNHNIEHRASALEKNSYDFVENAPSQPLPLGFRSKWKNRHLLAVAKCASLIHPGTSAADFPQILMSNGTERHDDEFIEVHIFGPFDFKAFEAIGASGTITDQRDKLTVGIIKSKAVVEGKTWLS